MNNWNMTGDEREKYASQRWMFATWTSANVPDTSLDTPLGWTIEVQVDANHSFVADDNEAVIDATLYVKQSNIVKTALYRSRSLPIAMMGPVFSSVTIPDSPLLNGKYLVAAGTRLTKVHASLAVAAKTASMQIRWRQAGDSGGAWNVADPADVPVTSSTALVFTIHYEFTHPVTLQFSCAEEGASNWGAPFSVFFDVESDLLKLEDFVIKMASPEITLTGTIREPSAQVKFARLELSTDGGAHWQDISDRKAGELSPYTFTVDITAAAGQQRDFSHGVYLRTTDNLQRVSPQEPARFDAATFLSARWDGASATSGDVNSGEALTYSVHLHCAAGVILPSATLSLLLADAAVEADFPVKCWYWMMDEATGEPKGTSYDAAGWRGITGAADIYSGPLQSGLINAAAHVRTDAALPGKTLPPATLTLDSRAFFVKPFTSTEPVRAVVWRPAPYFQIVNPVLHTHRDAVTITGIFTPVLEAAAELIFTVSVDNAAEQVVIPAQVNTNFFELKLNPEVFTAFSQNGNHSVRLALYRIGDTRADERRSHRETLEFVINNPSF
ncbi:hypothetical protein [Erwinia sp. V71]|uniref:hypothetical protein n=1 Tax=Erwinia sp. V71 TaxID=3369424 RepID=UPI003F603C92